MFSFLPGSHLFQFISLLLRTLNGPLTQTGTDTRRCVAPGFESCGILFSEHRPRANALTTFDRKPGARSMTWKEREMYES